MQTRRNYFFVRDGDGRGHFLIVTSGMSAHPYSSLRSHLCVPCCGAQKKLLNNAFVTEEVEFFTHLCS